MKLSKNFSQEEFNCRCGKCKPIGIHHELIFVLQDIRDYFERPVKVTSGYRCEYFNTLVEGEKNSKHLVGIAADIQVKDTQPKAVQDYIDLIYPDKYGLGRYVNFTHIDIRTKKARW